MRGEADSARNYPGCYDQFELLAHKNGFRDVFDASAFFSVSDNLLWRLSDIA